MTVYICCTYIYIHIHLDSGDFHGGPVVKLLHFPREEDADLVSDQGAKILHAAQCVEKRKTKIKRKLDSFTFGETRSKFRTQSHFIY